MGTETASRVVTEKAALARLASSGLTPQPSLVTASRETIPSSFSARLTGVQLLKYFDLISSLPSPSQSPGPR